MPQLYPAATHQYQAGCTFLLHGVTAQRQCRECGEAWPCRARTMATHYLFSRKRRAPRPQGFPSNPLP
jgi:hypothetical protein